MIEKIEALFDVKGKIVYPLNLGLEIDVLSEREFAGKVFSALKFPTSYWTSQSGLVYEDSKKNSALYSKGLFYILEDK